MFPHDLISGYAFLAYVILVIHFTDSAVPSGVSHQEACAGALRIIGCGHFDACRRFPFLHCRVTVVPLWLISILWGNTLTLCKYSLSRHSFPLLIAASSYLQQLSPWCQMAVFYFHFSLYIYWLAFTVRESFPFSPIYFFIYSNMYLRIFVLFHESQSIPVVTLLPRLSPIWPLGPLWRLITPCLICAPTCSSHLDYFESSPRNHIISSVSISKCL